MTPKPTSTNGWDEYRTWVRETLTRHETMHQGMVASVQDINAMLSKHIAKEDVEFSSMREQLKPLKAVIYGAVGTMLLAVLGALLTLVIKR